MPEASTPPEDVVMPADETKAVDPTQAEATVEPPLEVEEAPLEQSNTDSDSVGTRLVDANAERVARHDRERESAIMTVVKSAAINVHRQHELLLKEGKKGLVNPAELVLARLGYLLTLQYKSIDDPPELQNDSGEKPGIYWSKSSPMPRVLRGGGIIADRRADAKDSNIQPMVPGERQIYQMRAKERDPRTRDSTYTFTTLDHTGTPDGLALTWDENTMMKAFLVANTQILTEGLEAADGTPTAIAQGSVLRIPGVRQIVDQVVGNCQKFYKYDMNVVRSTPNLQVDIADGITDSTIETGIQPISLSKENASTLATNLTEYLRTNKKDYGEDYDSITAQVAQIKDKIAEGTRPSAIDIYTMLVKVGKPQLIKERQEVGKRIAAITEILQTEKQADRQFKLEKELEALKLEKTHLDEIIDRAPGQQNHLFMLLKDAEEGKMSTEVVSKLNALIGNAMTPDGFFTMKPDDLDKEGTLAHTLLQHFGEKTGKDPKIIRSWLAMFFDKHKGDISLMLIYALIQTASGVFTTAIKNT